MSIEHGPTPEDAKDWKVPDAKPAPAAQEPNDGFLTSKEQAYVNSLPPEKRPGTPEYAAAEKAQALAGKERESEAMRNDPNSTVPGSFVTRGEQAYIDSLPPDHRPGTPEYTARENARKQAELDAITRSINDQEAKRETEF